MTTAIVSLSIVYVAVTIVVAFTGWSNWSIARDMQRSYDDPDELPQFLGTEFVERQRARYEQEALEGARLFMRSPMWPVLALAILGQMVTDFRKDIGR